ncbi:MAG: serine hydrolase, partial [Caulobacteraceae bacterium]
YGMGLMDDRSLGVSVISHGGDLSGYHSNMFAIPDAGVAAVILTNADRGVYLRGPFQRKLMEVLYRGRDEAAGDLSATIKRIAAEREEFRSKLTIPADAAAVAALAPHYVNADLGSLTIDHTGANPVVKADKFGSTIATRKNDDGTVSVITIDPEFAGAEWVVGEDAGRRTLTLRDGQHVYVFTEG